MFHWTMLTKNKLRAPIVSLYRVGFFMLELRILLSDATSWLKNVPPNRHPDASIIETAIDCGTSRIDIRKICNENFTAKNPGYHGRTCPMAISWWSTWRPYWSPWACCPLAQWGWSFPHPGAPQDASDKGHQWDSPVPPDVWKGECQSATWMINIVGLSIPITYLLDL